jgi:hypothetical protein
VILLAFSLTVPAGAAQSAPVHVGVLGLDDAVWWEGGQVGFSPTHSTPFAALPVPDRCAQLDPCFSYALDVTATSPSARLRVGLDTPARDDGFEMTVVPPTGAPVSKQNSNAYSMEVFINTPPVGTYLITVAPFSAEHASFRMRAKVEPAPWSPATAGDLLPNLRVTRLWEFGFAAPANPGNGLFPPDDVNPPLSVLGIAPMSCAVDEQLGFDNQPSQRCLRYSFGLANAGEGNFDIRYNTDRTGTEQDMFQCIPNSNPAVPPRAKAAGKGAWHQTHGHFHYKDIIFHDVWRITDTTTWAREQIGTGKKIGYSPADQGIADWHTFTQMAAGTGGSAGNCVPDKTSRLGMSVGWGDAYRYQRPGNFVDFGAGGDGYFVVHTVADPMHVVDESNEGDNTAYAYLRIFGTQVDVIESGIGEGPWDAGKVPFER